MSILEEPAASAFYPKIRQNVLPQCWFVSIKIRGAINLTFLCPCIISIIVNDDQQDATNLVYLFTPNQLYMFRAMSSPIIRST